MIFSSDNEGYALRVASARAMSAINFSLFVVQFLVFCRLFHKVKNQLQ